jgi:signal recognition particle receptor subunit beta
MVFFNYASMEMSAKIVFYGPGLCGKTTNLKWIFDQMPQQRRGEMVSLATETDRTLFFDLLPLKLGKVGDFTTRIQLYTVPGQVFYNSTRKLVLKGVDGIVFVADSQEPMLDANIESLENLQENLEEQKLNLRKLPWVIQYNKRDLPVILPVSVLNRHLNFMDVPYYESIATKGVGVMDTLLGISSLTLRHLKRKAGEKISDDDEQLQQVKDELLRSFKMDGETPSAPAVKPQPKQPVTIAAEPDEPVEPDFDEAPGFEPEPVEPEPPVISQESRPKIVTDDEDVSVEIAQPRPVTVVPRDHDREGLVIDKDVTHKLRIPIKIVKTEDVAHVNLNLKLEIECVLQTETVKKQESKAEKLASQALEDFLLGKSKKRK